MKAIFTKQRQLLEVEIGQHILNTKEGVRSIHNKKYYLKLAIIHKGIGGLIKVLNSLEEDIYKEGVCCEQ